MLGANEVKPISELTVAVTPKSPWTSKLNMVALLTLAAGIVSLVMDSEITTADVDKFLLMLVGGITFVLRTWFTTSPTTMVSHDLPKVVTVKPIIPLLLLCLFVFGFVGEALAQKVYVEIDASKVSKYLVESDGKGNVTANPIQVVIPGNQPVPPGPQPPVPTVLTERAKKIKAAAEKVTGDTDREATAQGLAMLCRELAKRMRPDQTGKVEIQSATTASLAVKMGGDTFLDQRKVKTNWQATRDILQSEWLIVNAKGGSLEDYAILLDETGSGLDASVNPMLRKFDPAMLEMILRIIQFILDLLNR